MRGEPRVVVEGRRGGRPSTVCEGGLLCVEILSVLTPGVWLVCVCACM